ncbi:MAG TPA: magnesium/cobalt transporter CorA [Nocardioidaceae bacterium]|nr:magnesium/cobalt transporter CorA [Nocardioidaceae bacterium]
MIVDCAVYRDGRRVETPHRPGDIAAALAELKKPDDFIWVGMFKPTDDEMNDVATTLGLHRLAVEDAVLAHERPKLEQYDQSHMLFMVLKTLWYVDERDAVETGEIAIFVGSQYVVTVRHGEGLDLRETRRMLEEDADEVLSYGPGAVLYAVCDHVVDRYEDVAGELETDVDEVELSVFSESRTDDSQRIYRLKREVAEFRRAVMPLREPLSRFAQRQVENVPAEAAPFFRDVYDHAVRVHEQIETLDNLLSSAHDAYMARISVQQNDDMRKISAWVAIAAVPTLIAGIYGMNFEHMPELRWQLGYPMAIGLMALICGSLFRLFKKSGWL